MAHLMDLHSEEDTTFTFAATRHPVAVPKHGLATHTAHRAGTAIQAPSPTHSCMDKVILIILLLMKLKRFMKQRKK